MLCESFFKKPFMKGFFRKFNEVFDKSVNLCYNEYSIERCQNTRSEERKATIMLNILNSRLPGDPYAEYSHTSLKAFMLSKFMTARFEECENDKIKLSKLICEHLDNESEYKKYKGELLRVFEDGISEDIQLEVLREFKHNYFQNTANKKERPRSKFRSFKFLSEYLYSRCLFKKSQDKKK